MAYEVALQNSYGLAGALIAEAARRRLTREGAPALSIDDADALARGMAGQLQQMHVSGNAIGRLSPHRPLGPGETSFAVGDDGTHPALTSAALEAGIPGAGQVTTAPRLWLITNGDYELRAPALTGEYDVFGGLVSNLHGGDRAEQLGQFLTTHGVDLSPVELDPLPPDPQVRHSRIADLLNPGGTTRSPQLPPASPPNQSTIHRALNGLDEPPSHDL